MLSDSYFEHVWFLVTKFGHCSILNKSKSESTKIPDLPNGAGESTIANLDKMRFAKGDISTAALRLKMQKTMQKHAAVFRRGDILQVRKTFTRFTVNHCIEDMYI